MDKADTVRKYLDYQDSGQVDALLALLAEDATLVYPMGTSSGKAQIEQVLRARPGAFKPDYGDIEVEGDRAKVTGKLPPGMPISAVNIAFEFAGDLIRRIEIKMA